MRILLLVQFFDGPSDPGSDRLYALCRMLGERGHEVVVLTSPVSYKRARLKEQLLEPETFASGGSLRVEYVYAFADIRGSYLRRYWYFLTFAATAAAKALRMQRPDVIYAVSTPLSVGLLGAALAKRWRAPLFFEVTDVWPDAAVAVGVLRSRLLIGVAKVMERVIYAAAHEIVCLTNGIRDNIAAKHVHESKLRVVTNGVDLSLFRQRGEVASTRETLRANWDASNRFICMYLGAHGAYNALDTIIDAASHVRGDDRVLFILVGEGDVKASLMARVAAEQLPNVRFLGLVPRQDTPGLLGAADCFLLPILRGDFYDLNLPNKFFDYLASAAPVLVCGSCEAGRIVQSAGAGSVLPAEDGVALGQAILRLAEGELTHRVSAGDRGRALAEQRYSREAVFRPLLEAIEQART